MVNKRFSDVRPSTPVNAPAKKPSTRGHCRGRVRRRATGKGCGRVASAGNEVQVENSHVNDNPHEHNEDI